MRPIRHSWHVALRYMRAFIRQPAWVAIALVQPVIWLLLFGALFKSVTKIPGFEGGTYIDYLTPGVIVMTAVSSAGWNGMAFIDDMESGVMDRFLVSPVWRGALNLGSMVYSALTIAVQSLIICGLAYAVGAHFRNGMLGILSLVVIACTLGAAFAAFSNALALVARQRETLNGAVSPRASRARKNSGEKLPVPEISISVIRPSTARRVTTPLSTFWSGIVTPELM